MNEPYSLGFVDANILADAILAQNRIDEIIRDAGEHEDADRSSRELEDLFKSYEPARLAHHFFSLVLRVPTIPRNFVVTSNLALLEARSVIAEEYVERQLAARKIVRQFWESAKLKVRLSDEDLAQIELGLHMFKARVGHAMVVSDTYDFDLANRLVTEYRCNARDAILIATAIKNSCSRFLTRDDHLKRRLRSFKDIRITSLETVFNELGMKLVARADGK